MMELLLDGLSWLCLLGGGGFLLIGGIGVIRMPDFYTRMHATSLTDTLGMGLIIIGLMLQAGWTLVLFKLFLIMVFMLITSPTAAHALARAALVSNPKPQLSDPLSHPLAKEDPPSTP